jgi:hypothetical protein
MSATQTQTATWRPSAAKRAAACGDFSRLCYRIGDVSFGMKAFDGLRMKLDPSLQGFAADSAKCDVEVGISLVDKLRVPTREPLFASGGLWTLFAEDGGYRLNFLRSFPGEAPYKTAWFDEEFRRGELQLSREFFNTREAVYPMEYPLDEVLMIHHLTSAKGACGRGIEVHALGVVDDAGCGHLFLGHSGAGKSTSARLWQMRTGVRILSDDRIILRRREGQLWMYGTPWHGDAGIASPHAAPLTNVYVLEQAPRNELVKMPRSIAAAEIFARSFVPRHCPEALQFALQFIEQLCGELPCQTFRFLPNQSAVEAIRHGRG